MNCCVLPAEIEGLAGVTEIDTSVAAVTVRVAVPETLPDVARIVVEPADTDVARPFEPAVLLMVATAVFVEAQVAEAVKSCVVPFE